MTVRFFFFKYIYTSQWHNGYLTCTLFKFQVPNFINLVPVDQGFLLLIYRGETSLLKTPYFTATQTNRDPQALK